MSKNDPNDAAESKLSPAIGLALAGGAPQGAIYEIGALKALDEAIDGIALNQLGAYVGVSAGGFLTACLANGLTTDQMCRAIVKAEPGEHPFVPETFFRPAVGEFTSRVARVPGLLTRALTDYLAGRERRLLDALTALGSSLPVALFANQPIREYVRKIFAIKGRTDDFRRLERLLVIVSTDLESGESVLLGSEGWDHIPISQAVQASTALPGVYPPVEIDGRFYVDGVLRKTLHCSVLLEAGARLIFAINPIVPVDTRRAVAENILPAGRVIDQGLASVLSQTIRTIIHSRMTLGLSSYDSQYPDADIILLEPERDDHEHFFSNIFSFSERRGVCEHAYRATRRTLWQRRQELAPILERHGLRLRHEILEDPERGLWPSVGLPDALTNKRPRVGREVLNEVDSLLTRVEALVTARAPEGG